MAESTEIEAKFIGMDPGGVRATLRSAGYVCTRKGYVMRRRTFLFPPETGSRWVRVRDEGDQITMTYKRIASRDLSGAREIEVVVNDFDAACELILACGLEVGAFQESRRELWTKDDVKVSLDTWPGLSTFVEIEAVTEEAVHIAALALGFSMNDAIYGGVDAVYEQVLGIAPTTFNSLALVTFADPPTGADA